MSLGEGTAAARVCYISHCTKNWGLLTDAPHVPSHDRRKQQLRASDSRRLLKTKRLCIIHPLHHHPRLLAANLQPFERPHYSLAMQVFHHGISLPHLSPQATLSFQTRVHLPIRRIVKVNNDKTITLRCRSLAFLCQIFGANPPKPLLTLYPPPAVSWRIAVPCTRLSRVL